MRIVVLVFSLMFFTSHVNAQSDANKKVITGVITEVKPKFLGAQSFMVDKTELVLMANQEDTSGNSFKINNEFKDVIKKEKNGNFVLNPKYDGKSLSFTYFVNGKGWKCISHIGHIKAAGVKKTKPSHKK